MFRPFPASVGRHRALVLVLLITCLGPLALTGCTGSDESPSLPPAGVYEHDAASENSQAEPVRASGTAWALTRPLREVGWFCAQVRANADGRAVWCRIGRRNEEGTVHPQTAHFLLDRNDRLAWAWFPTTQADYEGNPIAVTAALALTAIWPGTEVREEIDDFDSDLRTAIPRPDDDYPRTGWRDTYADYSYDPLDGLVVTSRDASLRRWPFGSEHYATTMSSAVDDLLAGGYDCFYPPQTSCNRPQSNGDFRVNLRGDQIVMARFGIGSRLKSGRQRHRLTEEFPHGLTFLAEAVRRPVTERIEQSRRSGTGFVGIVAGTVVIIDARTNFFGRGDLVGYFDIQIGAPLAATLPT
ncbi:hypothetical protein ABZ815_39810 [Nonomuraea sp. NPDC047529]|uniref:hypothetical protein n=1 Tax=Nonomuraea sp. NPDC047529 TaxID=3155623 RepID=UPI0033CBADC1